MEYTDENVPIECSVCGEFLDGQSEVVAHIVQRHYPEYTESDAKKYGALWTEAAHQKARERDAAYYDERKLDRAIHADAFPQK
jgi:hypothetical protein